MGITFRQLNPHSCLTYLMGTAETDEVVLVDPLLEHVDEYIGLLKREGLRLTYVIDTHTHADHISGAAALKDRTGCEYVMHATAPPRCVTYRVLDGFTYNLGTIAIEVMHTPGHTKDSISLILPDRILTGDTLFLGDGGAGRDDLPGGNPGEHWDSLQRVLKLPGHLVVYPAHEYHGRQPSSLGEQMEHNPVLRLQSKEEYAEYAESLSLGPADWMEEVLKVNYACARDPKSAWVPVDVPACEVKGTQELGANDQRVVRISVGELKKRLNTVNNLLLLDVREKNELEGELGHLSGIRHIPVGNLSRHLSELEDYKGKHIVAICRTGGRAHTAAQILMQAGFEYVYVLSGGMTAWRKTEVR